jgi:peptidyl-prolyl cis-trans isomerase B (cyclophilin B)
MNQTKVLLETSLGNIVLGLDSERAPKTVGNFLDYVKRGQYENTLFHRVIDGFMIQGGGFAPGMKQKDGLEPIVNEANNGLKNVAYSIAMARTNMPHSASTQFFINVNDDDFLNHRSPTPQGWGYAVFGAVLEGKEVVDAIKRVKTGAHGYHQDVPKEDVVILRASVIESTVEVEEAVA